MTTNMKDRVITIFVAIVCSFGATFYGYKLAAKSSESAKYEERIKIVEQNKADKLEVKELRQENILMHQTDKQDMKDYFDVRFDDLKSFMIELNKRK